MPEARKVTRKAPSEKKQRPSFVEFFSKGPFKGVDLNLERNRDTGYGPVFEETPIEKFEDREKKGKVRFFSAEQILGKLKKTFTPPFDRLRASPVYPLPSGERISHGS